MRQKPDPTPLASPVSRKEFALVLLVALVVVVEFLLFRTYHAENVSPYFPRMWDQVATFEHAYRAHFLFREKGFAAAFGPGGPIADLAFKSTLVPVLGTILTFLFGPDRFAVGLVNFLIFVGAQTVVVVSLHRTKGATAALTGWGLLLLAQAHWINGLFDLRFDYAGLLAFGLAWVGIVSYLAKPTKRSLLTLVAALLFCAAARSISQVYAVATAGIVFVITLIATIASRDHLLWKRRLISASIALAISLTIISIYTASQWLTLRGYYGGQIGTLAGEIRWAEVGALFLKDRLIWYPLNWWPHYSKLVLAAVSVTAVSLVLGKFLKTRRRSPDEGVSMIVPSPWPWGESGPAWMLLAATLAVFITSPVVGPNIAVLGMLTVPTAVTLALVVDWSGGIAGSSALRRAAAAVVALLGAADWSYGMVTAREINYAWRERGEVGQKLLEALASNVETRQNPGVGFLWTHDIYNAESLTIYQVETRHKLPAPVRTIVPGLIELSPEWFDTVIARSTCVVAYLRPPDLMAGQYEWPALTSIRKHQDHWEKVLERDFVLRERWRQPCEHAELGLWVRKVSFGKIDFPGLETPEGVPAFWVRPDPFPFELINATDHEIAVLLQAPAWPGAGREQTAEVTLQLSQEMREPLIIQLTPKNRYKVEVPLTLKPGSNVFWLSARDTRVSQPPHSGFSIFIPTLSVKVL